MLTIDGKEYRNLEEQVLKNKSDINDIVTINKTLSLIGIKIVGNVETSDNLPDPSTYQGNYGDAYAVGTSTPYDLWIFTRPSEDANYPHWFNIGPFPLAGPVGPQGSIGPQGPQGPQGSLWYAGITNPVTNSLYRDNDYYINLSDGYIFRYNGQVWTRLLSIKGPQGVQGPTGATGATGPQGPQGPQGSIGPAGDPFTIAGALTSTDQLPDPTSVPRNYAYLIGTPTHLYVITGTDNLLWTDAGQIQGVAGPQGPTGPQGEQGPAGPQGVQGPTGATGNGVSSIVLDDGTTVATGTQYVMTISYTNSDNNQVVFIAPIGPKGDKGDRGDKGDTGPAGSVGPAGRDGTQILVNGVAQSTISFNSDPQTQISEKASKLDIYPVGSIYMSADSTSPASLFGGSWTAIYDRFLIGAGSLYANGASGGEETHRLTVNEMPSHTHTNSLTGSASFMVDTGERSGFGSIIINVDANYIARNGSINETGGSEHHNNMPPYLAVYMWKRTA